MSGAPRRKKNQRRSHPLSLTAWASITLQGCRAARAPVPARPLLQYFRFHRRSGQQPLPSNTAVLARRIYDWSKGGGANFFPVIIPTGIDAGFHHRANPLARPSRADGKTFEGLQGSITSDLEILLLLDGKPPLECAWKVS